MIEKVARGLYALGQTEVGGDFLPSFDEAEKEDRDFAFRLARAAIAAMREPTDAVLNAGPGDPYVDAWVWGQMIDAALKEDGT